MCLNLWPLMSGLIWSCEEPTDPEEVWNMSPVLETCRDSWTHFQVSVQGHNFFTIRELDIMSCATFKYIKPFECKTFPHDYTINWRHFILQVQICHGEEVVSFFLWSYPKMTAIITSTVTEMTHCLTTIVILPLSNS